MAMAARENLEALMNSELKASLRRSAEVGRSLPSTLQYQKLLPQRDILRD